MFTLRGDFKLFSLTGPQREGSGGIDCRPIDVNLPISIHIDPPVLSSRGEELKNLVAVI